MWEWGHPDSPLIFHGIMELLSLEKPLRPIKSNPELANR